MKPITIALFSALALVSGSAAKADHARVSLGFDSPLTHSVTVVSVPTAFCPTPGVAVTSGFGPSYGYAPAGGHWENVTIKTWIPGRWTTGRDRWGRTVKIFENGYYALRTEPVWVAHRPTFDSNHGWTRSAAPR